jgi:hypothetical protein
MGGKIHGRDPMVGSGMMNQPEKLEELQERIDKHERLTRGKPTKSFKEVFDQKMKKHRQQQDEEPEEKDEKEGEEERKKGAIDPLLGLSPGQKPSLANPSKDRRSAKFILKG